MLAVVGGTYVETTREPRSYTLFGSGGRAAAALSGLSDDVRLYTYVDEFERLGLEALASTFSFKVDATSIPRTVRFDYLHGLSVPEITPAPHTLAKAPALRVSHPHVLRFGLIEGDAVVEGDRVVYDPQSAHDPRPFAENGSTAEHLAVVCNMHEARALIKPLVPPTHSFAASETARALLTHFRAEVVVIKQGSGGALVATPSHESPVPAYRTERVWPIGSGDVFAAVFCNRWAEGGSDPVSAASAASRATAYYCNSRVLPIPGSLTSLVGAPIPPPPEAAPQIYLAGPFFTMSQRWLVAEARSALIDHGLRVFSPYHDVGPGRAEDVVGADLQALDQCAAVFAIADGTDSGTLFEIGYARAKGIPVVAFAQNETEENLKMLDGTACVIVDDFPTAIYQAVWATSFR